MPRAGGRIGLVVPGSLPDRAREGFHVASRTAVVVALVGTLGACYIGTPGVSPTASPEPPLSSFPTVSLTASPSPAPTASPIITLQPTTTAPDIEWLRQFGTSAGSRASAVAADASGVSVAGSTAGVSPGQTGAGMHDAFVRKYDHNGAKSWTRQFGSPVGATTPLAVAVDVSGVYVAGETEGALPGETSADRGDETDAFVRKYDPNGTELWTRQFGTSGSEYASAVAVDGSGVYVVGSTYGALPGQTGAGSWDAFVRKYDPGGTELWTRQFGTSQYDSATAVAADGFGVYVAGTHAAVVQTSQDPGDTFVTGYDPGGTELWTRKFGTSVASAVAVDASGVYLAGWTPAALPGGSTADPGAYTDAFVRKYDPDGAELWNRQFRTGVSDWALAVAADASGVYISGNTLVAASSEQSASDFEAFVRKYDPNGAELWTHRFGTSEYDNASAVTAGAAGVYVAGWTEGALPGETNEGGTDAFIFRYGL